MLTPPPLCVVPDLLMEVQSDPDGTWMFPMTPVDSMRLATFTVLPQMS